MRCGMAKDDGERLTIKTSSSTELLNGHSGHVLNRSYSKMGPVSPGAESALSMDEVRNISIADVRIEVD